MSNHTADTASNIVLGWVSSSNDRGTADIVWSCAATIFLCTYTALFLNAKPDLSRIPYLIYKAKWVLFTLFAPELVTGMACEQWRAAKQSVHDFDRLRKRTETLPAQETTKSGVALAEPVLTMDLLRQAPWTTTHAFMANMGGLRLQCPDFVPFPINAYQLFWLVENEHISYAAIDEKSISDKNKADLFARGITLLQAAWFVVGCIARGVQALGITTLELSTIAFVWCTLVAGLFWSNKPLDIEDPIIISTSKPLAAILADAGQRMNEEPWYTRTPLDFVEPPPKLTYVEPFFLALQWPFDLDKRKRKLPASSFGNNTSVPPRGLHLGDIAFATFFALTYFGIHLAAWNFHFPSQVERILWHVSTCVLGGTVLLFMFACWPGHFLGRLIFGNDRPFTVQQAAAIPRRINSLWVLPVASLYFLARAYIIAEGFVSLRKQPGRTFEAVDWWAFVPHV